MQSLIFLAALLSSPYPFEVKSGFAIEPLAAYRVFDTHDTNSVIGGARLTYYHLDEKDWMITGEIQAQNSYVLKDGATPSRHDQIFEGGLVFFERYHPGSFRVAATGGVERRLNRYRTALGIRGGLGYFVNQHLAFFGDISQRYVFRKEGFALPIDVSLSAQVIF